MPEVAIHHPDDDVLIALSTGRLADAEIARVSGHLSDCFVCCARIDQLAIDDHLLARLKQSAGDSLVPQAQRRSAVRALRHASEPVPFAVPRVIGAYEILGEVGRGGMGVVYKAWHGELQRLAALKMVLAGEFASRMQATRFRLEAELAARVKHPNIVQVHDIGDHAGRPYLVLEWIDGGSLEAKLNGTPWPPYDAAALVETLARAIHAAHTEGVVHRDLKPANVLMTADGTPKITDFGLAQPLEHGETLTRSGMLVGTPAYMAPEQASGNRALIGPATDTYALGIILYQLTTGQLPFRSSNTLELLKAITAEEPARPRSLRPALPRDLEAIVLQCLEKEPRRRYASALALAEDLQRYREHKPVTARPAGSVARLARASRRHPVVASLLALLAFSILAGLGGVTWKWREANAQRDVAEERAKEAAYQTYRSSLAAACAALEVHDVAAASRYLKAAPEPLRGWEWRHLHSRLDDSTATIPLPVSGGFLIPGDDRLRIGVLNRTGLCITDIDGNAMTTLPMDLDRFQFVSAIHTPKGLRVAVWSRDKAIAVMDETGEVRHRMSTDETTEITVATISPDGTRLACSRADRRTDIQIFDVASGRHTATCRGHTDTVWTIAFSPDSLSLASGGEDRTLRIWDARSGELTASASGHSGKILQTAYHPDGTRVLSASADGTVRQWAASTGREAESAYERHVGEVFSASYSPDGRRIASAGADRTVRLWEAVGRKDTAVRHGHTGRIAAVAFAEDGRRVMTISGRSLWISAADNTARLWDADPAATLPVLRGHAKAIQPLAFSPDGRWLASGSLDTTVRLWNAATGTPGAVLPHASVVWDLAYGPDGNWLITANSLDMTLRVWDTAMARVRKEIPTRIFNLRAVTVSPDGCRVAVSGNDFETRLSRLGIFDTDSGQLLFATDGAALAYSPDGRWLAVLAADDKTLLLLNAQTFEVITRFTGHEGAVCKAAFSPDSRRLASCSRDSTVQIWSIPDGSCEVLRGHTDEVYCVAFHPDGTRLATGCHGGAVWLWDLTRHAELVRLPGHKGFVWSLAFSPDGATLASAGGDSTVRLWDTVILKTRVHVAREAASKVIHSEPRR